ncbi:hypothetical protein A9Q83_10530 [Alphaproteobacteria bacterium 46_93_T64]|nr:hypothetical protein A9Q83_10530 [Alphaproteobacteria bacterium 46_93_T64]
MILTEISQKMTDADMFLPTVFNEGGQAPVLLICEHASNFFPAQYAMLGVDEAVISSHAAWDPGALDVARHLSDMLDAPLVAGSVSRLLYDCNRPPEARDSIPERSEVFNIPGNKNLSEADRANRAAYIYRPFEQTVASMISERKHLKAVVTIHSFTPVYHGMPRAVDVGILHDADARLANAMCEAASNTQDLIVRVNEPYGPTDGVTHTLSEFGVKNRLFNAMIEIKNNLVSTQGEVENMAGLLELWTKTALSGLGVQLSKGEENAPVH